VKEYKGNVHFFAGTIEEAKAFLDLGFSISFTGVITFVDSYRELVNFVPIERMFAETDSPYVAPKPFRGQKNNSNNVIEIYKKIAEIKDIDINEVIDTLYNNAKRHWLS
jgi:TatD DNase family protein